MENGKLKMENGKWKMENGKLFKNIFPCGLTPHPNPLLQGEGIKKFTPIYIFSGAETAKISRAFFNVVFIATIKASLDFINSLSSQITLFEL